MNKAYIKNLKSRIFLINLLFMLSTQVHANYEVNCLKSEFHNTLITLMEDYYETQEYPDTYDVRLEEVVDLRMIELAVLLNKKNSQEEELLLKFELAMALEEQAKVGFEGYANVWWNFMCQPQAKNNESFVKAYELRERFLEMPIEKNEKKRKKIYKEKRKLDKVAVKLLKPLADDGLAQAKMLLALFYVDDSAINPFFEKGYSVRGAKLYLDVLREHHVADVKIASQLSKHIKEICLSNRQRKKLSKVEEELGKDFKKIKDFHLFYDEISIIAPKCSDEIVLLKEIVELDNKYNPHPKCPFNDEPYACNVWQLLSGHSKKDKFYLGDNLLLCWNAEKLFKEINNSARDNSPNSTLTELLSGLSYTQRISNSTPEPDPRNNPWYILAQEYGLFNIPVPKEEKINNCIKGNKEKYSAIVKEAVNAYPDDADFNSIYGLDILYSSPSKAASYLYKSAEIIFKSPDLSNDGAYQIYDLFLSNENLSKTIFKKKLEILLAE